MSEHDDLLAGSASLVDAIDHLLNKGVVLVGETTLSVAGIDLVYVGLNVLLSSVETMQSAAEPRVDPAPAVEVPLQLPPIIARPAEPHQSAAIPGRPELRPVSQAPYSGERQPPPNASPPGDVPVPPPLAGIADHTPNAADERPERGLARLVLALVELLRQLLERQAVRRMEGQRLTDDEVERMGAALMALEEKMGELREAFGLSAEDINLDLGPLGRLLR